MPLSRPETDAPGAPDGRPAALARGAAQAVHAALREAKRAKAKKQATNMLLELLKEWPRARLKGAAKRKPVKHKPVKRGVTPRSTSTSRPSPYPRDGGRVCVGFLVRRRYRSSIAGQRTPRPLDECASNARSASRWRRCLGTAPPHSIHFPVDERQHPKRQQAFEKISSREFHEGPEYFPRHKCKLGSSDASSVFPPGGLVAGGLRARGPADRHARDGVPGAEEPCPMRLVHSPRRAQPLQRAPWRRGLRRGDGHRGRGRHHHAVGRPIHRKVHFVKEKLDPHSIGCSAFRNADFQNGGIEWRARTVVSRRGAQAWARIDRPGCLVRQPTAASQSSQGCQCAPASPRHPPTASRRG